MNLVAVRPPKVKSKGTPTLAVGKPRILVASPSTLTDKEWNQVNPGWGTSKPVYRDYALMKVLYALRRWNKKKWIYAFKWEKPSVPIDFSTLLDDEILYIVGHGDAGGLYPLGPNKKENTKRLVELLTKDGNIKKKRKGKYIIIHLMSCRAGLGLNKVLARTLFDKLGGNINVIVSGARGFTFGSVRTASHGQNEVLIKGLPWYMEYRNSISLKDAVKETQARENDQKITWKSKRLFIKKFIKAKEFFENEFDKIVKKLNNAEVNKALNELQDNHNIKWERLMLDQHNLYTNAKKASQLGFDMWYRNLQHAYDFVYHQNITNQDVVTILKQIQRPSGLKSTTIK